MAVTSRGGAMCLGTRSRGCDAQTLGFGVGGLDTIWEHPCLRTVQLRVLNTRYSNVQVGPGQDSPGAVREGRCSCSPARACGSAGSAAGSPGRHAHTIVTHVRRLRGRPLGFRGGWACLGGACHARPHDAASPCHACLAQWMLDHVLEQDVAVHVTSC